MILCDLCGRPYLLDEARELESDRHEIVCPKCVVVERVARAMFEAPDPDDPSAPFDPWPPSNPIDRQWFETRAVAAIEALEKEGWRHG